MRGLDPSCPLNSYYQVINAEIAYNTFINCTQIHFGTSVSTSYSCSQNQGVQLPIHSARFQNNIIFNTSQTLPFVSAHTESVNNMTFAGNLIRLSNTSFSRAGFSHRPTLSFVKNGLFYDIVPSGTNTCIPILTGVGGIPEIETLPDVTGNPRLHPHTSGAMDNANFGVRPKIPALNEVGVRWYNYAEPSL
jgi:hypothetical protein